ncbi:mechanosensitive ion channel family protein [Stappia sp.]|uniref:mechanosensitive ion channel family protein n=1 Tax=Stappia sp. TaxID=1870903 RepID=UPI003A9998DD
MTMRKDAVLRVVWPGLSTAVFVAGHLLLRRIPDMFDLASPSQLLHVLIGGGAYFSAAWLGGRLVGLALERTSSRRRQVPKLLPELISVALFLGASIATVMLVVGQSLSGALAGSGLVIAVLGFALRNTLADVFSGIAVGIEAPYRIADWVAIDDQTNGRVIEIGWRTTRLSTRDNTYVILPNSQIARQKLVNYSAPNRTYRARVQVVLDHGISVADAKSLLTAAAAHSPIIVATPEPDVRVASYDADGIRYHVRFWVPSFADDVDCRDAVFSQIDSALRARGLPLPVGGLRVFPADAGGGRELRAACSGSGVGGPS